MSGVFIDLSGFRLVNDPHAGSYVVFIIKISLGQYAWTVYRRFTAFHALSEQLRAKIPDCPPCPPKRLLGAHTPEFLEQRRLELLTWVRQLARVEAVCRSPEFHEFLRDQANVAPAGMADVPPVVVPPSPVGPAATAGPQMEGEDMREGGEWDEGGGAGAAAGGSAHGGGGGGGGGFRAAAAAAPASAPTEMSRKPCLRDFSLLKVVGKGSFGKVMQVRKRDTGRIYAMKVLHKSSIVKRNQVEHTRTERNVLGRVGHPFIVGLNFAFQSADKLYFVLDCASQQALRFPSHPPPFCFHPITSPSPIPSHSPALCPRRCAPRQRRLRRRRAVFPPGAGGALYRGALPLLLRANHART
jgi:hypothetical protein